MNEQESHTLSNVGRSKPALPAGAKDTRASTAENALTAITPARPAVLRRFPIPSKSMPVRRLVVKLYETSPHLARSDVWTAIRWATMTLKFQSLAAYMDKLAEGGTVRADGEPRKLLTELRALADSISRHEQALGVSAASRAALGVDILRGADLASLMAARGER